MGRIENVLILDNFCFSKGTIMTLSIAKLAKGGVVGAALLAMTPAANAAATLTFTGGTGGFTAGQTNYADFTTTFGTYTSTGSAGIYTGTSGSAAEPAFGDQGDAYFAVLGGGATTFIFGAGVSSFGFDLGSADDYNSILVTFANGATQLFSGAGLNPPGPASGNQDIAGTNGRVTIFNNGMGRITSAQFSSTANSFEFDNIGVAGVPEPGTWAMLILGFGMVGGALRRRAAQAKSARVRLTFA